MQQRINSLKKSEGATESEKHLARLANRTFLSLWSYPSPYRDQKPDGKGDGKEMCDLLVVCGSDIIIFSDKYIEWKHNQQIQVAWQRWYRKAIQASVKQLTGAEKWILNHPTRVFVDRQCTQRLPVDIPVSSTRNIHAIAVAGGACNFLKKHFRDSSGSLFIAPFIRGEEHQIAEAKPFFVGDVDPDGLFIHLFTDASLDFVMEEFDTITDFVSYLKRRKAFIRSGKLAFASSEEDLLAYYMTHLDEDEDHDFVNKDGTPFDDQECVFVEEGFYTNLRCNPRYVQKKREDVQSEIWDALIEAFTSTLLSQGLLHSDKRSEYERGIRYMAMLSRLERRIAASVFVTALRDGMKAPIFSRLCLPQGSNSKKAYFVMSMKFDQKVYVDDASYRSARRNWLHRNALRYLLKYPNVETIIGIASEPTNEPEEFRSTKDLLVAEQPQWTAELVSLLKKQEEQMSTHITETPFETEEFPKSI